MGPTCFPSYLPPQDPETHPGRKGACAGGLKHSLCGVFRDVEMPGNASAVSSRKGMLALS